MNFQHLRHFIAVAEELHFGRAAERLGMAQPPLSQSIRRLEDSLGCALFIRTRRRVELTPAGVTLLEHGREIVDQVQYAQSALRRANEAGMTKVMIGFTPNALSDVVPVLMRELRRLAPGVDIELHEAVSEDQVARILKGDLDLGFFHPMTQQIRGLEMRFAERSPMVAAIPEDWPLAQKETLTLADLGDQPLMMFPMVHRPEVHALLLAAFRKAGVANPRITQEATYSYTRLKLVAAGLGVTLVSEATAPRGYPGVVLRMVEDLPEGMHVDTMLAWRRAAPPAARKLFLAAYEALRSKLPSSLKNGEASAEAGFRA